MNWVASKKEIEITNSERSKATHVIRADVIRALIKIASANVRIFLKGSSVKNARRALASMAAVPEGCAKWDMMSGKSQCPQEWFISTYSDIDIVYKLENCNNVPEMLTILHNLLKDKLPQYFITIRRKSSLEYGIANFCVENWKNSAVRILGEEIQIGVDVTVEQTGKPTLMEMFPSSNVEELVVNLITQELGLLHQHYDPWWKVACYENLHHSPTVLFAGESSSYYQALRSAVSDAEKGIARLLLYTLQDFNERSFNVLGEHTDLYRRYIEYLGNHIFRIREKLFRDNFTVTGLIPDIMDNRYFVCHNLARVDISSVKIGLKKASSESPDDDDDDDDDDEVFCLSPERLRRQMEGGMDTTEYDDSRVPVYHCPPCGTWHRLVSTFVGREFQICTEPVQCDN